MPRSAIRVGFGIGRLGQRAMHVLAVSGARRAIGRRAHQRMTKPHPRTELDQPRRLGRRRRVRPDGEPLGHPPQQRHVPHRLGGRRQQQPLRRNRKRPDAPQETLLDLTRQRPRVRTPEPTGQLRRRQPPRQLQQGQRIAAGLGDDPVPDALVEPPGDRRIQKRTRIAVAQTPDHELRQPHQVVIARTERRSTHREHQRHPLRQQPPRDEGQRLRGDPIKPLSVVHDADQRLLLGHLGQQAEHRQPHQETVRRAPRTQTERDGQRITLRTGKATEMPHHRHAQLVQPGERQLHLRLDASSPRDLTSCRAPHQVLHQRGLADPRLAAQDQHLTLTSPGACHQPIQRLALATPATQPAPRIAARHHHHRADHGARLCSARVTP